MPKVWTRSRGLLHQPGKWRTLDRLQLPQRSGALAQLRTFAPGRMDTKMVWWTVVGKEFIGKLPLPLPDMGLGKPLMISNSVLIRQIPTTASILGLDENIIRVTDSFCAQHERLFCVQGLFRRSFVSVEHGLLQGCSFSQLLWATAFIAGERHAAETGATKIVASVCVGERTCLVLWQGLDQAKRASVPHDDVFGHGPKIQRIGLSGNRRESWESKRVREHTALGREGQYGHPNSWHRVQPQDLRRAGLQQER